MNTNKGRLVPDDAGRPPPSPSFASTSTSTISRAKAAALADYNRKSVYHPASAADGGGIPEVYWSEENDTPTPGGRGRQVDAFTFLREPTPEPVDRKKMGVGVGAYSDDSSTDGHGAREKGHGGQRRKTCGMSTKWFWVLVGSILLMLLVIGIGVGVGVSSSSSSGDGGDGSGSESSEGSGDGQNSGSDTSSTSTISSADAGPTTASETVTTTTTSTPSPSTTGDDAAFPTETSSGALTCPQSNNTLYAVPGSSVRFHRLCKIDFPGVDDGGSANDIGNVSAESMAECMRNCAGTHGCTGAGWGSITSGGAADFRCWLKSDLKANSAVNMANWEFAIMQ